MSEEKVHRANEAQIGALIETRRAAVRSRDIEELMKYVGRSSVSFDVVDPLQYVGSREVRKRAEAWLDSFEGPVETELRNVTIVAGEEIGFSHCLTRVSGVLKAGGSIGMWFRTTVCYQKVDENWTITHEHNSVPFDPREGTASLNLEP